MKAISCERAGGFTLIEAIVALVLMATTLTSIYAWVNTDLISLRRAEATVVTQQLAREALRQLYLQPLGPGESGDLELGEYQMRWESRLVEPTAQGRMQHGSVGLYDLTLYEIDFSLHRQDIQLGSWSTRQLRHKKERSLEYE
jgi:general secretion pathway protein I